MLRKRTFALAFLLFLTSCGTPNLPAVIPTPIPSRTPLIVSPTPIIITATKIETPIATPTLTSTPAPQIVVDITGCNTSVDVSHQMGEVTNAYALVRNLGATNLTNVCATLYASDEARQHPDKTQCTASLPMGFQVLLKLTVDTGFKQDTAIWVEVVSGEGFTATVAKDSCRDIGVPGINLDEIGLVVPIP